MRLFLAIDLPDDLRDILSALQGDLTAGRTTDPDTLHLTLAFLGDIDPDRAEALHDDLCDLRHPAFDLALAGLGTFGTRGPQALFVDVADPGPVTALHKAIRSRIRLAGIELPRERFRPHVTIARFRKRMRDGEDAALHRFIARNAAFRADPFRVTHFAMFDSTLTPAGAEHEEIARYPLTS